MKQICEYLSTKIQNRIVDRFPIEPNYDEIIAFFKKNAFIKHKSTNHSYSDIAKEIINANAPTYIIGDYDDSWTEYIMFGGVGSNYTTRQIFFIRTAEELIQNHEESCFMYWIYDGDNKKELLTTNAIKLNSYDEFVNEVKKYFNWN